jgi:hypothetical protein
MANNEIRGRVRQYFLPAVKQASSSFDGSQTFSSSKRAPRATVKPVLQVIGSIMTVLMCLALPLGAAHAQDTSVGFTATRTALAQRIASDEAELAGGKAKSSRREELHAEIASIKDRLDNGDFKTGDLVVVTVTTGPTTKVDTSTVRDNGMISITSVKDMSVRGILRSELLDKVTEHVKEYIKFPQVRVNFTTRVTMLGAVNKPGSLNVSPDRQLNELVGLAGGGAQDAKLDQLEVKRGKHVVLSYKDSKRALIQGKTLEQVGILPGDEVTIPATRHFSWTAFLQAAGVVATLLFTLITFLRYYYSSN